MKEVARYEHVGKSTGSMLKLGARYNIFNESVEEGATEKVTFFKVIKYQPKADYETRMHFPRSKRTKYINQIFIEKTISEQQLL